MNKKRLSNPKMSYQNTIDHYEVMKKRGDLKILTESELLTSSKISGISWMIESSPENVLKLLEVVYPLLHSNLKPVHIIIMVDRFTEELVNYLYAMREDFDSREGVQFLGCGMGSLELTLDFERIDFPESWENYTITDFYYFNIGTCIDFQPAQKEDFVPIKRTYKRALTGTNYPYTFRNTNLEFSRLPTDEEFKIANLIYRIVQTFWWSGVQSPNPNEIKKLSEFLGRWSNEDDSEISFY